MILDNPFRRLGLAATASPRDVRRRIDELAVKASLGAVPELPPDELSRLRQALEDPVQRARHEIFWLHSPADVVEPSIDVSSSNGSLVAAIETLRSQAGGTPSIRQAISLHDLAVLSYARFLHAGNGADPGDALPLWAAVLESKPFWEHVAARAVGAADARLTPQVVERIREEMPGALLEPFASRVAAQVDAGELDAAASSVRFIRSSGLPRVAIDAAARRAIAPLRARIEAGAKTVEDLVGEIPASEGATAEAERRLKKAERSLIERVLVPMALLCNVDPVFNDESVGDRAAEAARRLSVAVCNLLEDWEWGYALVRQAMEMARTPSYLAQLAGEQALVRSNYHWEAANDAAKLRRPDLAAAHYELAIPYARSDEQRTNLRNMAAGARSHARISADQVEAQKRQISSALEQRHSTLKAAIEEAVRRPPAADADAEEPAAPTWRAQSEPAPIAQPRPARRRWWIAGVAAAALIAIAVAIGASHNGSSSGSGVQAPPDAAAVAQPPQQAATSSSSPDCSQVSILSNELDALEAQIKAKRRLVSRVDSQISPIKAEINQIIRDYPSKQLPSDVWNRFVPLRAQYKALVAKSNNAVRDGNALVRLYNGKLKTYRRLNGEC